MDNRLLLDKNTEYVKAGEAYGGHYYAIIKIPCVKLCHTYDYNDTVMLADHCEEIAVEITKEQYTDICEGLYA